MNTTHLTGPRHPGEVQITNPHVVRTFDCDQLIVEELFADWPETPAELAAIRERVTATAALTVTI